MQIAGRAKDKSQGSALRLNYAAATVLICIAGSVLAACSSSKPSADAPSGFVPPAPGTYGPSFGTYAVPPGAVAPPPGTLPPPQSVQPMAPTGGYFIVEQGGYFNAATGKYLIPPVPFDNQLGYFIVPEDHWFVGVPLPKRNERIERRDIEAWRKGNPPRALKHMLNRQGHAESDFKYSQEHGPSAKPKSPHTPQAPTP